MNSAFPVAESGGSSNLALDLASFLSVTDAARASRVLRKLRQHGLQNFHLTGRLALETHRKSANCTVSRRPLNDIDIVVPSFVDVPDELAQRFLVRHLHPNVQAGKIVVQLVDAEDALRIDVFSAYGATLTRSQFCGSLVGAIPIVSVEDLAARNAALLMNLEQGREVARKHAEDFEWLSEFACPERVEIAWQDHRKTDDPSSFKEARARISKLVESSSGLLVVPVYSQDLDAICLRCQELGAWRLASGEAVMSILGYV